MHCLKWSLSRDWIFWIQCSAGRVQQQKGRRLCWADKLIWPAGGESSGHSAPLALKYASCDLDDFDLVRVEVEVVVVQVVVQVAVAASAM